jgi:hypothetical protein
MLRRSHLTTTQAKQTNENMKAALSPRNGSNPMLKKHCYSSDIVLPVQ